MAFKIEQLDTNIVSVDGHQFPVDSDLKLNTKKSEWFTKCFRERYGFENKPQLFRSYHRAGQISRAFAKNSILQVMTERKVKGTRILPGFGVFTSPTYIRFLIAANGELVGRAFAGYAGIDSVFRSATTEGLIVQLTNHYNKHYDEFFDQVEKNCFFPTTRAISPHRRFESHLLPTGVHAHYSANGKRIQVKYNVGHDTKHFANTDLQDSGISYIWLGSSANWSWHKSVLKDTPPSSI